MIRRLFCRPACLVVIILGVLAFSRIALAAAPVASFHKALDFNGTNNRVSIPDNEATRLSNNFTIEFWIKATSTSQLAAYVVTRDSGSCSQTSILFNNPTGTVSFYSCTAPLGDPRTGSELPITDTQWHHVAYSYDGTWWSGYLDGAQVFSWERNFSLDTGAYGWSIGAAASGGSPFSGQLDELRIWNVGRSAAQIQADYRRSLVGNETGLVAYYRFDEGTGSTVTDSSSTGQSGTLSANPPTWVTSTAGLTHTTAEDTDVTITLWGRDPDGDSMSASINTLPASGTLYQYDNGARGAAITSAGTVVTDSSWRVIFAPAANGNGSPYDTFGFVVNDGTSDSSEATVTVNVTAVNDTPVITSNGGDATASVSAAENTTAVTTVTATDVDAGDTRTYSISGGTDAAKFSIVAATGALTFQSAPDFENPTDSDANNTYVVEITVTDTGAATDVQTITVTVTDVNDAPMARDAGYFLDFNGSSQYVQVPDADALDPTSVTIEAWIKMNALPLSGNLAGVVMKGPGDTYNYHFQITDTGLVRWATGHVSGATTDVLDSATTLSTGRWYHITGIHDAATGTKKIYINGKINSQRSVASNLRTNSGPVLFGAWNNGAVSRYFNGGIDEVRIWNTARSGSEIVANMNAALAGNEAGLVGYWRFNDGSGTSAADAAGGDNPGTLSGSPVWMGSTSLVAAEGGSVSGALSGGDVEGSALTYIVVSGPSNGTVNVTVGTGAFTYTHNGGETVSDSFTFKVNDGAADSAPVTVNITVTAVNDTPTASNNTVTTNEDTAHVFAAGEFNFSDVDGDTLAKVQVTTLESAGALKYNNAGTWEAVTLNQEITKVDIDASKLRFTPAANANGAGYATFGFKVHDGTVYSGSAYTITIDVTAVNDAPSFTKGANQTVDEDAGAQTVAGWATNISAGPADESGQTLTFNVTNNNNSLFSVQPAVAANGTLTYTPAANANGSATVTVSLSDDGGTANGGTDTSAAQTFTITVNAVNDAPTISDIEDQNTSRNTATGAIAFTVGDAETAVADLTVTGSSSNTTLVPNDNVVFGGAGANRTVTITPAANQSGTATITITVTDGGGLTASDTFVLTVTAPSNSSSDRTTPGSIDIIVNGEKQEQSATVKTTTQDGKTTTTVNLDQQKLEQRLEREGNDAVVTVLVTSKSDVVAGELNGRMVKNMEQKQAVLEIKTETATYTLPADQIQIDDVSAAIGTQVELKDIKVRVEIAKSSADTVKVLEDSAGKGGFTVVAAPVDFNVKGTHGGKTVQVSKFNAFVERLIALPAGVDPNRITTGVRVLPDGTVQHVPTRVTVIDGRYYAKINSLVNSAYSVIWHPKEFADVAGHWSQEAVNDMGSRKVIEGVDGTNFVPDRAITRAEFAAVLVRGLGLKPGGAATGFSDVTDGDWFRDYVSTAVEYGLVTGYGDGTFRPGRKITREEAMAMTARAMKLAKLETATADEAVTAQLGKFGDGGAVSGWARAAVAGTVEQGLVQGDAGGRILPGADITRAETATIIRRLLQRADLI